MALPTSGWISTPQRAPLTSHPLPEPVTGTYRDGGEIVGRKVPQPAVVLAAGGAEAVAFGGRNADRGRALSVTLTRREAFGVLLVDSVDFNYQPPPPVLDRSYRVHLRIEVQDADGAFRDLSALEGRDWVEEVEWDEDIDQPVSQATVTLRREAREGSLAPMLEASPLNRVGSGAAFAPLLQPGREIRVHTATTYPGEEPRPEDWKGVFRGILDEVDWGGGHRVRLSARDLGSRLLDTFIEEKKTYSAGAATEAWIVMQEILDDALGQRLPDGTRVPGAVLLHLESGAELVLPGNAPLEARPGWAVHDLEQEQKNVLDALRDIALQFGWDVRYRWNAARTDYRLTLFSPDREKTLPDHEVGPSHYLDVTRLSVSHADVRNVVRVVYTERDTGARLAVLEEDAPSIARFGRRFVEIEEASASLIDTVDEAVELARYILNDLADPLASQEVEMLYFWPARIGDLFLFEANGVHYDADQLLAAVRLRHSLTRERHRTTVAVRGRPAGAYRGWLRRDVRVVGKEELPPVKPIIEVQMVDGGRTEVSYRVSAASPDGSPVTLYYAYGADPFPETSNLANPGTIPAARIASAEGRLVRIRATTPLGGEEQQVLMADFDEAPEIVFVNPPVPLYQQGAQVGWLVTGAVDDDARGLRVEPGDLALGVVSPQPVVSGGAHWLDTSTRKTFSVEVLQALGAAGTLRLFPTERFSIQDPGVVGEPYEQPLARPPVTATSVRELSATRRSVTFTPSPAASTLNYRVLYGTATSGSWSTVVHDPNADPGSLTSHRGSFTVSSIDVTAADATVEFYASVPGGINETVQRLRLDRDSAAGIVDATLAEGPAHYLTLGIGTDDDLVTWKAWARRGAEPVDPRTGEPDDTYLRFSGTRNQLTTGWYAAGHGDAQTSTWHVLVRGYDYAGSWTEVRRSVVVTGAPPTVGFLQNVRGRIHPEGDGYTYNDLLWDHNSYIEENPAEFTVSVYENDVLQVSGRDVRYDHDENEPGPGGLNIGGWHRRVATAASTDPNAQYLTFRYRMELFHQGTRISTYTTSISGWYLGNGSVVETPTGVPGTPVVYAGQGSGSAYWSNTSSAWQVEVVWESAPEEFSEHWWPEATFVLPAGSTSHSTSLYPFTWWRCRVAYRSTAGTGSFSEPGNAVYISDRHWTHPGDGTRIDMEEPL